jgi:hypothetical protein
MSIPPNAAWAKQPWRSPPGDEIPIRRPMPSSFQLKSQETPLRHPAVIREMAYSFAS